MWFPLAISVAVVGLVQPALSQYFPPTPEDLRTVSLKNGLSISYKQVPLHLSFAAGEAKHFTFQVLL